MTGCKTYKISRITAAGGSIAQTEIQVNGCDQGSNISRGGVVGQQIVNTFLVNRGDWSYLLQG